MLIIRFHYWISLTSAYWVSLTSPGGLIDDAQHDNKIHLAAEELFEFSHAIETVNQFETLKSSFDIHIKTLWFGIIVVKRSFLSSTLFTERTFQTRSQHDKAFTNLTKPSTAIRICRNLVSIFW